MKEDFKKYEKSIKRKHCFALKPKHSESFKTSLDNKFILPLVLEVFHELGWMVVFRDDKSVEAKSLNGHNNNQKITVTFQNQNVNVESSSSDVMFWDVGRNSKRVGLFIYAFQNFEKEESSDLINEKLKEFEEAETYETPDVLPKPTVFRKPNFAVLAIGAIATAIFSSMVFAFIEVKFFNVLLLYYLLFGLALGYMIAYLIPMSNYTKFNYIRLAVISSILIYFILNLFFRYYFISLEHNIQDISFIEFIEVMFEEGLYLEDMQLGTIGLVVSWIVQLAFAYFTCMSFVSIAYVNYHVEKVPSEVVDFAYHHIDSGKTESQVRSELAQMGWKRKEDQDSVFDAIHAVVELRDSNRE